MRITGRRIIRTTTNSNARPPVQQSIKQTRTQIYKDESMKTEKHLPIPENYHKILS